MSIKNYLRALALGLLCCVSLAQAETPQEAAIRKLLEPRLGEGVKVDAITKTNYAGLYEVRMGSDIVYTDEKAQFIFAGNIFDSVNGTNYTKQRTEELLKIKFSDLPLDSALKSVKGDGKRVMAIFEDPNCGYCKKFRQTLLQVPNLTVYTFMYNILAEDSEVKSRNIWCSANRAKAWDDWMLNNKEAPKAAASCKTPNEKVYELGRRLKVNGTPTIFYVDGTRSSGVMDVKALEERLNAAQAKAAKS